MNYKKCLVGNKMFILDIADNLQQWITGLGGKSGMRKNGGLLFAYPFPARQVFWMKDMQFPIDIILFDDNFICMNVFRNCEVSNTGDIADLKKYDTQIKISKL